MKKCAVLGIIFLFTIFNFACKDDPQDDDPNINIEKEFKILPWETLSSSDRSFHLNIETIQPKSCENSQIDFTPTNIGNQISLIIKDIPEPDCPAPFFSANANYELGSLSPIEYSLQISLKDLVHNEGSLIVTDEYYEIAMENLDGIIIPNTKLYKVPEAMIWGYVSYSSANEAVYSEGFIDEVKGISENEEFQNGYYGYFSIENNSLNILNEDLPKLFNPTFGFKFQDEISQLETILADYRSLYPNIDFKIFTSTGEAL